MLVEIRGAGFVNKGAQLMLLSVVHSLSSRIQKIEFAIRAGGSESKVPYVDRARLGLYQKAFLPFRGKDYGEILRFAPRKLRDAYGIKVNSDVDVVLDISGFAYGDQWPLSRTDKLYEKALRWRANGTSVYLLPQALGPFSSVERRESAKKAFDLCEMIYAREQKSFENLSELNLQNAKTKVAPDFTNLLKVAKTKAPKRFRNRFCVIPNEKMLTETPTNVSESYLNLLLCICRLSLRLGMRPFVLVHETNDADIARQLISALPEIESFDDPDPLTLKAVIGASTAVFSSRFHGLVSALSQSVPAIGTSWSHKYRLLFDDYGVHDGLIDLPEFDEASVEERLLELRDESKNKAARDSLSRHSRALRHAATVMWDELAADMSSASS